VFLDAQPSARITSAIVTPSVPSAPSASADRRRRKDTPNRVLCLGEALVDLICERQIEDVSGARSFVPHFGGAVANVAAVAAATGTEVALAGGAGKDDWGEWLRTRLVRYHVDVSQFRLIDGAQTLLALVVVAPGGEPRYEIFGDAVQSVVHALGERVELAVRRSGAVLISSNTLVGAEERSVTMRAREVALELGRPVIFDVNLRLHRWRSRADAAASSNACVAGALLVRATAAEAALMTGEDDPGAAAAALLKAGARMVVLTMGAGGAMLRGELKADVPGARARVLSTVGAGDVLTGVLLSRLAASRFYPPSVAAALPRAVEQSARACERWGALD
jgi:sugar/nucleoside kinase (ribokinase family)